MEPVETLETVQLYGDGGGDDEDVKTEVVGSYYTLQDVTSPKRRRSKAQGDMHDKPKKPRSAYLLYYFDFHQVIQQESPNLPQSEINKRISESWKRLNVAEKGYYLERAKLEKEGVDTSSVTSTQDLPGFRKILPRANYVLLPKDSPSSPQAVGDFQPEPSPLGSLGPPVAEHASSASLPQETQFPALALGSPVEFAEQCIAVEVLGEEMASVSSPVPRGASCGMLLAASEPGVIAGNSAYSVVKLKADDSVVGRAMVEPMKQDIPQLVTTIIAAQNLLESKSVASTNSVSQVMMVSVGAGVKQITKPSYKMAVKTYTRRGRGRCLAPGCAFVYVTRHKPPTCPQCGSHLGGKWVPTTKKTAKQSKQLTRNQKAEINSDSCQPKLSSAEDGHSTASIEDVAQGLIEGQFQQSLRKQHVATKGEPLEGSSTKTQTQARLVQSKATAKGMTVKGQDKSHVTMKKRPVRPILPAFCTSGEPCHSIAQPSRAVLQFITVPPDKGKTTCNNNPKSVITGTSMSGLKPSTLKQLGHIVPTTTAAAAAAAATVMQYLTSLNTKGMNILSVVPFKQNTVSSFDLGLSTARGRGRCKNPSCDYVYKNRHKPAECPKCGLELSRKNTKKPFT
ncbi:unnamed protein product [Merluccius merluccius]